MTFLFWFLPSLLWKKTVAGSQSKEERLAELEEKVEERRRRREEEEEEEGRF